mmetsp:Transcript_13932/g.42039  ORF Transcript_13932/g.42039 Transcript_13932/m.42039 type:complete len:213 (-) Transcript_13932:333-971(-)
MAGGAQRSVLINGVGTVRAPSIVRANSCRSRPVRPTLSQRAQQTSVQTVRKNLVCRAEAEASVSAAAPDTDASTSSSQEGAAQEPADPRFTATIKKPLGMVVAEAKDGSVFVEEITEGGNADAQGVIKVGDIVRKTSARVLKEGKSGDFEKKGHGARPFDDWEAIMFTCDGEDFDTVMAAIGSNNERWGIREVTLEVSRPKEMPIGKNAKES